MRLIGVLKTVGHEAAAVGRDSSGALADPNAGDFAADDPGTDHGMISGEIHLGMEGTNGSLAPYAQARSNCICSAGPNVPMAASINPAS